MNVIVSEIITIHLKAINSFETISTFDWEITFSYTDIFSIFNWKISNI